MATVLEKQYNKWLRSVLRVPKSSKMPLVTAYLSMFRGQRNEALRSINRLRKTQYQIRRFREWERGSTKLPLPLKAHMQEAVIKARFGEVGVDLLRLLDLQSDDQNLL